ncbi:hypothetical protein PGIGA_G00200120, partial [Pangasianodon gigas]|nr:hypothetical protein [Pangasianodon gigas]
MAWKDFSGAESKAAPSVDLNSPFTSAGTEEIVIYSCPLINTVAHSKGLRAVESSSSRLHWSGFKSRFASLCDGWVRESCSDWLPLLNQSTNHVVRTIPS